MGYQALLFCADEKTARLVTQVLTELDFAVEPANEPFAAVKRLTTQHFDAVVVDCENEQNGSLLFKTARNSGPNRTSLAVAVVEGQPGIAKAFRIGANLVLTKPINVEQSKGTLRVARGLLKKSDAAKPAAQPGAPAVAARAVTPVPPRPIVPPRALTTPPVPVVRAEATSNLELDQDPVPQPEPADAALLESMPEPVAPPAPRATAPRLTPKPAPWGPPKSAPSAGMAAGAAPAKEVPHPRFETPEVAPSIADALPRRAPESAPRTTHRAEAAPAPFLSAAQAQPSGSRKGLIIGIAAAAVALVAIGYFGATKLHQTSSTPSVQAPTQSTPVQGVQKPAASAAETAAQPTAPNVPETPAPSTRAAERPAVEEPEVVQRSVVTVPKPSHESITVKSSKPAEADAPQALPVIGMGTDAGSKGISGLVSTNPVRTPVLRTMKVSQGVSQGLIVKRVPPDYPMQARQLRLEGAVQVEATISKDGNVTNVKVLGGHPILARAATDAIKQWKYKPYMLNGTPVEIETQIIINFKLP